MKAYDKYKNSGVEWLGEIPEHWEVKRLAVLGRFSKGGGFSKANLVENEGVLAVLYGDIYTKYQYKIKTPIRIISEEAAEKSVLIQFGDLLFTGSGETKEDIGKCVAFNCDAKTVAGGDVIIFKQSMNDSSYLSYFLNTEGVKFEKAKTSKGEIIVHTYESKLRDIYVALPQIQEQKAIATFLDEKCGKIDEAISIKEKQIALLKEHRQIIIQEAVTKGLDKNVKLKDSGVDWIGEIPEHWEVKRLKYIFNKIQTGATPSTTNLKYFGGDVNWFNPKDLNVEMLNYSEKKLSKAALVANQVKLFEGDSILIVGIGATAGKTSYLNEKATFNQQITGFKSMQNNNKFYFFLFKNLSQVFLSLAQFTTLPILNNEFFKKVLLPLPSKIEQQQIVDYLEEQTSKIDKAIGLKIEQVEKLKLYKQSLINDVVTGKVRVS